jgi:hypothetical protein
VASQNAPTIGPGANGATVEFKKRVEDYLALQQKLDKSIGELPKEASPQQLDAHQRALGALIQKARPDAKVGTVFSPEMQAFVKQVIGNALKGPAGGTLRASILDENPVNTPIHVNGRYPDTIPMSTMPPDILRGLPELPKELEYRFVGDRLVLLDVRAHLIVDYVEDAFPV